MSWIERTDRRSKNGKTWQDDVTGQFTTVTSIAPLHYEAVLDSGVFDAPVNATPVRVTNAALDGWTINANGFHYALGKPSDKPTDGWVGFGGRQGQNWFKFRLLKVGYLHWPTRAWDDVSGAPTYVRARLTNQTKTKTIGPNAEAVNIESIATWNRIWTTPV